MCSLVPKEGLKAQYVESCNQDGLEAFELVTQLRAREILEREDAAAPPGPLRAANSSKDFPDAAQLLELCTSPEDQGQADDAQHDPRNLKQVSDRTTQKLGAAPDKFADISRKLWHSCIPVSL